MSERQRVVVTGMGAITPLGLDLPSTWDGLIRGQSGISRLTSVDRDGLAVHIGGEIKDFDPTRYLDRKEARHLDRYQQLGIVAVDEAIRDAALAITPENSERVGVVMGTGAGGIATLVEQTTTLLQRGPDRVSPFFVTMFVPSLLSGVITIRIGARGPSFCIMSACATSAHCIGEAVEIIRRGDADVVVAGGAEAPVTPLALAAFDQMHALSRRNDEPERASRPFDRERDGFVLAEGAGAVVLESLDHAQRRDARLYAEVVGYGATSDAYHITAPSKDGEGAARAMRLSLRQAGINPREIGYINAHATSTPQGDAAESQAIKTVFGADACPPVSSTKSATGHLFGAAGVVETIFCVKAIVDGWLPPTLNYDTPDPGCDLDYIPNVARRVQIDAALTNGFGFGGQNCSLVFRRIPGPS